MVEVNKFRITVGDRRTPLLTVVRVNGKPISLSGLTVEFQMTDESGADVIASSSTGVTAEPTFTATATATTDRLTAIEHAMLVGDQLTIASSTTLPGGLAASTRYFVIDAEPNTFRVSLSPDGLPVNITDAGTGTHTVTPIGFVKKAFAAADVDTAGIYRGYFRITGSGLVDSFPVDGIPIEIVARG